MSILESMGGAYESVRGYLSNFPDTEEYGQEEATFEMKSDPANNPCVSVEPEREHFVTLRKVYDSFKDVFSSE